MSKFIRSIRYDVAEKITEGTEFDFTNNVLIIGPSGFDTAGEQATLFLGDNNHYIQSEHNQGLNLKTNNEITFQTGGSNERMVITLSGNVGIGTNNPQSALHVVGTRNNTPTFKGIHMGEFETSGDHAIEIVATANTDNSMIDFTYAGNDIQGRIFYSHNATATNGYMAFFTAGQNERMRISGNGNVGIGTVNPVSFLQVGSVSSSSTFRSNVANFGTSNTGGEVVALSIHNTAVGTLNNATSIGFVNANNYSATSKIVSLQKQVVGSQDTDLIFQTYSSTLTEKMRISGTGYVGIGTNNPDSALHVRGTINSAPSSTGIRMGFSNGDIQRVAIELSGSSDAIIDFNKGDGGDSLGRISYSHATKQLFLITEGTSLTLINAGTTGYVSCSTNYPTSSIDLNDPQTVLFLSRPGTINQSLTPNAQFSISRWANAGVEARTRLDISLRHDSTNVNIMTMRSNGNVGIGIDAPIFKLQVAGNGHFAIDSNRTISLATPYGNTGIIFNNDNNGNYSRFDMRNIEDAIEGNRRFILSYNADNDNAITIRKGGNVGIGTNNPSTKLDVRGILSVEGPGGGIRLKDTTGNPFFQIVTDRGLRRETMIVNSWGASSNTGFTCGTSRTDGIAFQVVNGVSITDGLPASDGTQIMVVGGNGNVGIGTNNPLSILNIAKGYQPSSSLTSHFRPQILISNKSGEATDLTGIAFANPHIDHTTLVASAIYYRNSIGGNYGMDGYLGIAVADPSTGGLDPYGLTEGDYESLTRLTINNSGYVGIGTNNPDSALHVRGTINSAPSSTGIRMGFSNGDIQRVAIELSGSSDAIIDFNKGDGGDSLGRIGYSMASDYMTLFTNNSERIRIISNGNVGIGKTNPSQKLDVNGGVNISGSLTANKKMQSGSTNGGGSNTGTVTFPVAFDSTPVVVANLLATNTSNIYIIEIKNISTTGFSFIKSFQTRSGGAWSGALSETFTWIAMVP